MMPKIKAVIVDVDGTVAKITRRNPHDTAKCGQDEPIAHVIELVRLFSYNGYRVLFCSGREASFRDLTDRWLKEHVSVPFDLFMRPAGDKRKDSVVKEEIYVSHIKDMYSVRAVIDDRLQVCQLWHKLGLPLFRVGDPDAVF